MKRLKNYNIIIAVVCNGHTPKRKKVSVRVCCSGHVTAMEVGQRQRPYPDVRIFTGNYHSSTFHSQGTS